jgi:hypothetical protein
MVEAAVVRPREGGTALTLLLSATRPTASSLPFSESAVIAIMAFVSQNEKEFHACPSMPHAVAAEASHAVAADGTHAVAADGTHTVAGDGSHAVAADRRAFLCSISRVSPPTTS